MLTPTSAWTYNYMLATGSAAESVQLCSVKPLASASPNLAAINTTKLIFQIERHSICHHHATRTSNTPTVVELLEPTGSLPFWQSDYAGGYHSVYQPSTSSDPYTRRYKLWAGDRVAAVCRLLSAARHHPDTSASRVRRAGSHAWSRPIATHG